MLYGKTSLLVRVILISSLHLGTDNGQTFSTPDNLNNETSDFSDPQISSSGNNVYVVWEDSTLAGGNDDIFFAFSTDNGLTFSTPDNLSESTQSTFDPQISSSGNNVYVVWEEFTLAGNADIFFAFSTNNGQTFSVPDNLSESTDFFSIGQQISSSGNNVYVVWREDPSGSNADIFFAFSTDNGQTFSTPDNISEILNFPLLHKSPLQEIPSMLYGKMTFLLTSEISFLHSVQIMARRLVLLITLVRVLKIPVIHKSPLQEIPSM